MKISIPVTNGLLSAHFGHCQQFAMYEIDGKTIVNKTMVSPPPHEPGTFPKWLHEQGATVIIAGGMGSRAQALFAQQNIQVLVGAGCNDPDGLIANFLEGKLETGANACDH